MAGLYHPGRMPYKYFSGSIAVLGCSILDSKKRFLYNKVISSEAIRIEQCMVDAGGYVTNSAWGMLYFASAIHSTSLNHMTQLLRIPTYEVVIL